MRKIHLILGFIFLLFAIIQFNDPDPLMWICLYGGVAAIAFFAAYGKFNIWIILLGIAVCAFELFKLFPSFWAWVQDGMPSIVESMKAESLYIELVREFLGIVVALGALVYYYLWARKRRTPREDDPRGF